MRNNKFWKIKRNAATPPRRTSKHREKQSNLEFEHASGGSTGIGIVEQIKTYALTGTYSTLNRETIAKLLRLMRD